MVNVSDEAVKKHENFISIESEMEKGGWYSSLGIKSKNDRRKSIWWGRMLMESQLQPHAPLHVHRCSFMLQSERRWSFIALFLCFPNRSKLKANLQLQPQVSRRHRRASTVVSVQRQKQVEKETEPKRESNFYFRFRSLANEKRRNKKKVSWIFRNDF